MDDIMSFLIEAEERLLTDPPPRVFILHTDNADGLRSYDVRPVPRRGKKAARAKRDRIKG